MRPTLLVLLSVLVMLSLLGGCGPDGEIIPIRMQIMRARVEQVGTDRALVIWETSVAGDSKVDFGLLTTEATGNGDLESVSDEQYVPLLRDGGVTVPDPRFVSVSNTRYHIRFGKWHEVELDDLLPGRTYVATVSSSNYLGTEVREFGVPLMFTTLTP